MERFTDSSWMWVWAQPAVAEVTEAIPPVAAPREQCGVQTNQILKALAVNEDVRSCGATWRDAARIKLAVAPELAEPL